MGTNGISETEENKYTFGQYDIIAKGDPNATPGTAKRARQELATAADDLIKVVACPPAGALISAGRALGSDDVPFLLKPVVGAAALAYGASAGAVASVCYSLGFLSAEVARHT